MFPTRQRLVAGHFPCHDRRLHLIVEFKLSLVDGTTQVVGEFSPVSDSFVQYGIVETRFERSLALGAVHCEVGVVGEGFGVIGVVGEYGNADACAHARVERAEAQRRFECRVKAGDELQQAITIMIRRQGDEFVTAEPSDNIVLSQFLPHPFREHDQDGVAGLVAVHVIDFLEAVEVDGDDSEFCSRGPRDFDLALELSLEAGPVRQAGERIVHGHMMQVIVAQRSSRPGLTIYEGGGDASGNDQQADKRRSKTQCAHFRRGERRVAECEGRDAQCRHRDEVQCRDSGDEKAGAQQDPIPSEAVGTEDGKCGAREDDRAQHRDNDIGRLPRDESVDAIGSHSGEVHRRDGATGQPSADKGKGWRRAPDRDSKAERRSDDRDNQRDDRQNRIDVDRGINFVSDHRNKVRAPDRRAGGDPCQEDPPKALQARCRLSSLEHLRNDERAEAANDNREQYQPWVMFHGNAKRNVNHWTPLPTTQSHAWHVMGITLHCQIALTRAPWVRADVRRLFDRAPGCFSLNGVGLRRPKAECRRRLL